MPHRKELIIVKIGGNIVDDPQQLDLFLRQFAALNVPRLLVHGGGKLATRMATQLGIEQQMIEGRRITDQNTLRIVTMVYAGLINKQIVASLQREGCNALGLSGADGNVIKAHKRSGTDIDYGFVGDVDEVNASLLHELLNNDTMPVLCPITHDGQGQLLNTNADTIAQSVATALSSQFRVSLIYSFEKEGVLENAQDETSVISDIDPVSYQELKVAGKVFAGMIPKLDNAFEALNKGVDKVIIGKAENLQELIHGTRGSTIRL